MISATLKHSLPFIPSDAKVKHGPTDRANEAPDSTAVEEPNAPPPCGGAKV
jgi:hypothetical protein